MTLRPDRLFWAALLVSIGAGLALAPAADAAKARKHSRTAAEPRAGVVATPGQWGTNLVQAGPLYNGNDYIGTDPDPNIRSFLIRDLSSRYGSSY